MLELLTHPALVKALYAVPVLCALFLMEAWFPLFPDQPRKARHDVRNIAMAFINALPLAAVASLLTAAVAAWVETSRFGLLHAAELSGWQGALCAVVILDFWMYGWHRANHRVPFLWRFHRMHHSDTALDASSAFRFHMGEVTLGAIFRTGVMALAGLGVWHVVLYDAILLPVILFHHANIRLHPALDRALRCVIVTPGIHQVHHSRERHETDSNYSSVFSWWDRLARTLRLREDNRTLKYGLDGWDDENRQTIKGMLRTPLD